MHVIKHRELVTCQHIEAAQKAGRHDTGYKIVTVDDKDYHLCRACYGALVMQVIDNLKQISIKVR